MKNKRCWTSFDLQSCHGMIISLSFLCELHWGNLLFFPPFFLVWDNATLITAPMIFKIHTCACYQHDTLSLLKSCGTTFQTSASSVGITFLVCLQIHWCPGPNSCQEKEMHSSHFLAPKTNCISQHSLTTSEGNISETKAKYLKRCLSKTHQHRKCSHKLKSVLNMSMQEGSTLDDIRESI